MPVFLTALSAQPAVLYLFVIVSGAAVGSFLSMFVYRLPHMLRRDWENECRTLLALDIPPPAAPLNLAWPGSHCPQCQTPLTWTDNIPLIGFLLLHGRCRHCRKPIPRRYLVIEILTTAMAVVTVYHWGLNGRAALAFCLGSGLIALTFIDLQEQLLPDVITLPLLWLGLLANISATFTTLTAAVIGAAAGYLSLWLIYHAFRLITGKEGMGYGDFKLLAVAGAWVGWPLLPFILLLASLMGAASGITAIAIGRQSRNTPIPFGPFLAGALWIALLYGHRLLAIYLGHPAR